MPNWIIAVEWGARGVLILLFLLSIWSIAIIIDRYKILKNLDALESVDEAKNLISGKKWDSLSDWVSQKQGIRAGTLRAALAVQSPSVDHIERSVKSYLIEEKTKLEKGFTTLATLGSNAPFVGLFGTVLGIIQAFGALAQSQSNMNSVMAAISEALVATAIGLFVAIPAVVAYNLFSRKLKLILTDCESLRDFYISRLN